MVQCSAVFGWTGSGRNPLILPLSVSHLHPMPVFSHRQSSTCALQINFVQRALLGAFLSLSSLPAKWSNNVTIMGLSSIGISFLVLPLLCVSPRPQNFEMKRQALEVSLGMNQDSDMLDMVHQDSAELNSENTNSNQSDLVQSMALTCPPPVASFLRYYKL